MAAAGSASEKRVAWEALLSDVSRVLPKQVYLQSLSAQSPTPLAPGAVAPVPTAPAGTPTPATTGVSGFTATGVASSHVRVAIVLDRLASLPWLTNVTLVSTANGSTTGTALSRGDTFTVTAGFNPIGGAE
jgi:Tfp pilus assembly protein PilN